MLALQDFTSIANLSSQCWSKFASTRRRFILSRDTAEGTSLEGFDLDGFLDLFARFRLWAGNIGALEREKSSLDNRLRNSNLGIEIRRLLNQLLSALIDLYSLVAREREQQTWYEGENEDEQFEGFGSNSDESEYESAFESKPNEHEDDPVLVTESGQLLLIVQDAIASLLKLSIVIHRSTRRAKFARSSKEKQYDTIFDISHVAAVFPHAANNRPLIERLGKANAQRRQWLAYRKSHRQRLAAAVEPVSKSLSDQHRSAQADIFSQSPESSGLAFSIPVSSHLPLPSAHGEKNETEATTFYDESHPPGNGGHDRDELSETSHLISSSPEADEERMLLPRPPLDSSDGNPFECPFCFTIIVIDGLKSWVRHVHSDLASYVCTFENCPEPLFESRHQWFQHEMEVHRRQWTCPLCGTSAATSREFEAHVNEAHSSCVGKEALFELANQPLQRTTASACPLCDYPAKLNIKMGVQGEVLIQPRKLRNHIARHLEHLALFVLPRDYPRQYDEPQLEDDDYAPGAGEMETSTRQDDEKLLSSFDENTIDSIGKALSILRLEGEDSTPHVLDSPPALALGWQPPHDFTPVAADFDAEDPDLVPRREESMFGGDLFTPGWVRGYDDAKEGYCARCDAGHWVNIPDGTYEFHLTYTHGLASNGLPLPRPSMIRKVVDTPGAWEAFCDACQAWRLLKRSKRGWNWFRHCLTEHDTTMADSSNDTEDTPLQQAREYIQKGQVNLLERILKKHPNIVQQATKSSKKTLLHYAAESGHIDLVKLTLGSMQSLKLIREGIDGLSALGATSLMLAAGQGNQDIVENLVEQGADVNLADTNGKTALDIAAHAGYGGITHYLIQNGANMRKARVFQAIYSKQQQQQQHATTAATSKEEQEEEDKRQQEGLTTTATTPPFSPQEKHKKSMASWNRLMSAAYANDLHGVNQSLLNGHDIESQAVDGRTPLMIAASRSNHQIINLLLDMGANIDAINNKGWTTLMYAVSSNDLRTVNLLRSRGADVNHVSPDHWTALAEAAQHGHLAIMESLLRCGADPESRSSHDWTPLMHCCYKGDETGVNLLLAFGADVGTRSQHDETPLLLAAATGRVEIVRILLVGAKALPEAEWARKIIEKDSNVPLPGGGVVERAYPLGWTPSMVACQGGHTEVVRLLLMAGANLEPRSPMGRTALEIAREHGWVDIIELLEQCDEDGDNDATGL